MNTRKKYICFIKALQDLKEIFGMGKVMILKVLIKIKALFEKNEPRYLLNILYIDDFCIFLQNVKEELFLKVVKELQMIEIKKEDLDINLNEIEEQALEILSEEFEKKL